MGSYALFLTGAGAAVELPSSSGGISQRRPHGDGGGQPVRERYGPDLRPA